MTTIKYRQTCTDYYDGVTTRHYKDVELTPEAAVLELALLSERSILLYEALNRLRYHDIRRRELKQGNLHAFVNFLVGYIYHSDKHPTSAKTLKSMANWLGKTPDTIFYDVEGFENRYPYEEDCACHEWTKQEPYEELCDLCRCDDCPRNEKCCDVDGRDCSASGHIYDALQHQCVACGAFDPLFVGAKA